MHERWDIEKQLVFNDLKQNRCLRHRFTQAPNSIRMLMALVAVARNLMLRSAHQAIRNMAPRRTLTTLARQVVQRDSRRSFGPPRKDTVDKDSYVLPTWIADSVTTTECLVLMNSEAHCAWGEGNFSLT